LSELADPNWLCIIGSADLAVPKGLDIIGLFELADPKGLGKIAGLLTVFNILLILP
jgi:hypothetical protein